MDEKNALHHARTLEEAGKTENGSLPHNEHTQQHKPSAKQRRFLGAVLIALIFWCLIPNELVFAHLATPLRTCRLPQEQDADNAIGSRKDTAKVALEAHIMSKCPDARDCLRKLIVPTMEKVHDKVDFNLSFIGTLDPQSDAVSCMHGPSECLGNIIILCTEKLYPEPKLSLGFANCMISDYPHIPQRDLVEGCAMEHGIDFKKVNECISDEGGGVDLLRSSIMRSADHNVTKSCTVRLGGEIRCIRDGGEWYDCDGGSSVEDLVSDIEELYQKASF